MERDMTLQTLTLCNLWSDLLDHAGRYAERYYLSCALEGSHDVQHTKAYDILNKYYKGSEAVLSDAIQQDLASFPVKLLEIRAAQTACGLPAFSGREDYLNQIMMGLTMTHRHGKERRNHYRRQVEEIFDAATKGQATPRSLNQLEENYGESQKKADARKKAKKAA